MGMKSVETHGVAKRQPVIYCEIQEPWKKKADEVDQTERAASRAAEELGAWDRTDLGQPTYPTAQKPEAPGHCSE